MRRWLKCLINGHFFKWRWNWHGDAIDFAAGGNRSAWKCRCCGKWLDYPDLVKLDSVKNGFRR